MAYTGTHTITFYDNGRCPIIYITVPGLDADTEVNSGHGPLTDYHLDWLPSSASFIVETTSGTTAGISVKVQGSFDGTNWEDTGMAVTAKDTYDHFPVVDWGEPDDNAVQTYLYWRIYCTTVGSGNTLTGKLWLYNNRR